MNTYLPLAVVAFFGFLQLGTGMQCQRHLEEYSNVTWSDERKSGAIARLTSCLITSYYAIGSPFGEEFALAMESAAKDGVQNICKWKSSFDVVTKINEAVDEDLIAQGQEMKIHAFDFLMKNIQNKTKACGQLPELVSLLLVESGLPANKTTIRMGTYLLSHFIKSRLNIRCKQNDARKYLKSLC
ncbi:uncharacterized protein LOC131935482 [Physella acuta]|uniref:uncharacterized protein LOC131935482 n=1 Tax=Physella acuta TaxID=109671 RepID=UPI0027DC73E6|nr:uncharacterized protein LOC131935482 [Physella acuta]